MPHYLYFGMHGWPVPAFYVTFAQEQQILQERQRLHTLLNTLTFSFCYIPEPQTPPTSILKEKNMKFNFLSLSLATNLSSSSVLGCFWLFWIIWLYLSLNEHHMNIFTYRSNNNKALMLLWNAKRNQSGKGWEWGWGWEIWENSWNAEKTPTKPEGIMQSWWHPVLKNPHLKHWLTLCSKKRKKSKWKKHYW